MTRFQKKCDVNRSEHNAIMDIEIVALNVCGLRSKLKSTVFEEFIHKFKLIFLTETKLHSLDDLNIPNYRLTLKNRKGAKRCFGRVAILVHESIDKYVKCLEIDIKESLWITFSGLDKSCNIIFGLVYNSPADSPYANSSTMDLIENTIVKLPS